MDNINHQQDPMPQQRSLAHDLNNSLANVMLTLELLGEEQLGELNVQQKSFIQNMVKDCEEMNRLISASQKKSSEAVS